VIDWMQVLYAGLGGAGIGGCIQCAKYAHRAYSKKDFTRAAGVAALGVVLAVGLVLAAPQMKTLKGDRRAAEFEQTINDIPAFRQIAEQSPAVRGKLLETENKLRRGEIDEMEALRNVVAEIVQVFVGYAAITSDKAIIDYTKTILDAVHTLHGKSAQLCSDFVHSGTSVAAANELSEEQKAQSLNAMLVVVKDALASPQMKGKPGEVMEALKPVFQQMRVAGDPASIFRMMHDADPEKVCNTVESFYGLILLLPEPQASLGLRSIFSGEFFAILMHVSIPSSSLGQ